MQLTKEQKYQLYASIAGQFEKARLDKGWSLEEAEKQTGQPQPYLLKLEHNMSTIHNQPLGKLLKIASGYDKVLKVEFVAPPKPV